MINIEKDNKNTRVIEKEKTDFGILKNNADKVLFAINSLSKSQEKGTHSRRLIKFMNSDEFLETIGTTKEFSEGSIYGTLSRLRGKGYVQRFLKQHNNSDELIYKITAKGETHLDHVLSGAEKQIDRLSNFVPSFGQ